MDVPKLQPTPSPNNRTNVNKTNHQISSAPTMAEMIDSQTVAEMFDSPNFLIPRKANQIFLISP